jgi:hypothetical protein
MKDVTGENGRAAEICQRSIDIDAGNKGSAANLAIAMFCDAEKVKDWSLHADRVHVIEADFPS